MQNKVLCGGGQMQKEPLLSHQAADHSSTLTSSLPRLLPKRLTSPAVWRLAAALGSGPARDTLLGLVTLPCLVRPSRPRLGWERPAVPSADVPAVAYRSSSTARTSSLWSTSSCFVLTCSTAGSSSMWALRDDLVTCPALLGHVASDARMQTAMMSRIRIEVCIAALDRVKSETAYTACRSQQINPTGTTFAHHAGAKWLLTVL